MIKLYEEEKERNTKDMKEKIKNKKIVISMLVVLVLVLCCIGGYVAKINMIRNKKKFGLKKLKRKIKKFSLNMINSKKKKIEQIN